MKVVISGYTYTRENLFEVFDSYLEKENLFFILPSNWKAKGNRVVFKPFKKDGFNIYHSPAFFKHSFYPIIGGLFKGWMPFFVPRLVWLRFNQGAKILFTTGEPNLLSTLYNAVWAKILGMKHVFHFWENIPYEEKDRGIKLFLKKTIIKANVKLSDGAICGMHKAEDILRPFGKNLKIGTFLHAGFDPNKFKPGIDSGFRKDLKIEDKFIFLFVGALGYRKGIHLILDSLSELRERHDNLFLLLVGSGEYEEDIREQVDDLNLNNLVHFIPWLPNEKLPDIYASSDVFLYPSIPHEGWEEQFGYSIAEASLCRLPVISTRTGSIEEVLIDGRTGIMIEPNNYTELTRAMESMIINKELGESMGAEGREFIINNFSNEIIASKIWKLFKNIYESNKG